MKVSPRSCVIQEVAAMTFEERILKRQTERTYGKDHSRQEDTTCSKGTETEVKQDKVKESKF